MVDVSTSDARSKFADIIARVQKHPAPIYLTRHGKRIAAVIAADEMDRLLELAEDMEDIRAADDAEREMEETGEAPIPWEVVRAELGL